MVYNAGSATLLIIPSFKGVVDAINEQAAQWGTSAGKSFSDTFNPEVGKGTKNAPLGPSDDESSKQGTQSAGAFGDAFRARLKAALDDLPKAAITADSSDADRAIADLRAQLAELHDARIGVDLSDDEAVAKAAALQAQLKALAASTTSVQVKYDASAAAAQITELNKDLDDQATKAKSAEAAIGDHGGGGLLGATISLTPALIAMGAAGGGALIGVAGAAVAAGVGLGAFALASKDEFSAVSGQAKAMLTNFQQVNAEATFPAVIGAVRLLPQIFQAATPLVRDTSSALVTLESDANSALGDPTWKTFFTYLGAEGNQTVVAFGSTLGGAATAAAGLDEAFSPLINHIDTDLGHLGQDLSAFGSSATGSAGLAGFVNYALANGPLVAATLEQIGSDFISITRDVSGLGPSYLTILNEVAKIVGDVANADPALLEMGLALLTVTKLAGPISLVGGALATIWNIGDKIDPLVTKVSTFATTLGGLRVAGEEAEVGEEAAGIGMDTMLGPLALVAIGVTGLITLFAHSSQVASQATQQWIQGTQQQVQATSTGAAAQTANYQSVIAGLRAQNDAIDANTDHLKVQRDNAVNSSQSIYAAYAAGEKYTDMIDTNNSAVDTNNQKIKGLQGSIDALQQSTAGQTAATDALNDSQNSGISRADQLALAHTQLTAADKALSTSITNVSTALAGANKGFLDADGDANNVTLAMGNLATSFATNGTSLDGLTTAGANNRNALDATTTSVQAQITQMAKQHASISDISGVLGTYTYQLGQTAGQAGVSQTAIQSYLNEVGLTPKEVNTTLKTDGYTQNLATVTNLNGKVQDLSNDFWGILQPTEAVAGAQDGLATSFTTAASDAVVLAAKQNDLQTANSTLATAINSVSTALAGMNGGFLTLDQGNTAINSDILNFTASLKANGDQMDGNTTAAVSNQQGIQAVSSAMLDQIGTLSQQHASVGTINGDLATWTGNLEANAGQYGLSQTAVENYLTQVGLTPAEVDTTLVQNGYTDALNNVSDLNSQISQIKDKKVTVTFNYATVGGTGQAYSNGNLGGPAAANGNATGGIIKAAQGTVMPMAAAAAGMVTHNPTYLVGEDGSGHDEFVIPTNPRYHAQAVNLTKQLLPRIGMNALAAGGTMGSTQTLDYITDPDPDVISLVNAQVASAGQAGMAAAIREAAASSGVSGDVGLWIDEALSLMSLPSSLANGIAQIIQRESGGNPSAINLWDSNAAAGHPSQGLMQTIPSTFAAYVLPGLAGLGIDNPVANITAGVRYAIANYGESWLAAGGNHSGGYASGGVIGQHGNSINWYQDGGIFSGPSVIGVGEAGDEVVAPIDDLANILGLLQPTPSVDTAGFGATAGRGVGRDVLHIDQMDIHDEADLVMLLNRTNFALGDL